MILPTFHDAVNVASIVRDWDDEKLAHELRRPIRLTLPAVDMQPLIVEALARILERRTK